MKLFNTFKFFSLKLAFKFDTTQFTLVIHTTLLLKKRVNGMHRTHGRKHMAMDQLWMSSSMQQIC